MKKLGIKPGTTLALLNAPDRFVRELAGLPEDVQIVTRLARPPELTVWFVQARRELDRRMKTVGRAMGQGLWVAWPKRASGVTTDLTEDIVRAAGLANGLVDYKVCAINETWSGLRFARRKKTRHRQVRS